MKSHGELTANTAQKITRDWEKRGYKVLHDHGPSNENVGRIVSWIGKEYGRGAQLSQIDIAIVEKKSEKAFVLIEIEEKNDRPKNFLGNFFGILLGDHISFGGKYTITVDKQTTLLVIGKSKASHEKRNKYLCEKVMKIKSGLSTGNSAIGNVVIETFSDEDGLDQLLSSVLDRTFKGALKKT
jgi:hypothetical protein